MQIHHADGKLTVPLADSQIVFHIIPVLFLPLIPLHNFYWIMP